MDFAEWAGDELPELTQAPVSTLPGGRVRMRDSFYTAPGYREIGMFYSCVPDPAYPWDPQIMKAIQKHAPDAVPLWVHWVFLSPQETGNPKIEIFGRHALGRVIKSQHGYLEPFRVLMPTMPCQGLSFERPNDIWFIHQGPMGKHPKYKDLPGDYLPFDHNLLDKVIELSRAFRMTDKEYRELLISEMIDQPIEAEMMRNFYAKREHMLARAEVLRYIDKQYDKLSDQEVLDHYAGRGFVEAERKVMVTVPEGSTPS